MTRTTADPGLELDEDPRFQEREWRVQRLGSFLLAAFVFGASLGLFGTGPLARGTAASSAGLRVDYDRFARRLGPSRLRIHVPPAARNERVRVWIGRGWMDAVKLEHVSPSPESVEVGTDRLAFVFRTAASHTPGELTFDVEMREGGLVDGEVHSADGSSARFRQLVYP